MSRPLNEDGTVPLKRRLQLVLRVTGDEPIEVVREIKARWVRDGARGDIPTDLVIAGVAHTSDGEEWLAIMAEELANAAGEHLEDMLRELLAKAAGRRI